MGSILSAINDDIDDYEALCQKYGEKVQRKATAQGVMLPDCYGEHSTALKYRSRVESDMARGKTKEEAEKNNRHMKPQTKPKTAWDRIKGDDD